MDHSKNSTSRRFDSNCLMPEVPVLSSSQYGSLPMTANASPTSVRIPAVQAPLSHRDPWNTVSPAQPQARARTSFSAYPAENIGHNAQLTEDISGTQASAAYTRPQRKSSNRDEFDGPHQLLNLPSPNTIAAKDQPVPILPRSLSFEEQYDILDRLNEVLSRCAFDFVARYQFPIPVEPERRLVISSQDREWAEWVYLLKRLATKRRIPARVLHDSQIKHLVTVLENSLQPPSWATHQDQPVKDDRTMLQFISAGTQVAKMLKDSAAMSHLDRLYTQTASCIQDRRRTGLPI